jgi:hypothetical protein
MLTDIELLIALETCTLPDGAFGHEAHVRTAYLYLRHLPLAEAAARMSITLRRYAASLGKADRYHETIRIGFMALINDRMHDHGDGGCWASSSGIIQIC